MSLLQQVVQQQQASGGIEPVNLTLIIVTAINGLFLLLGGIFTHKTTRSARYVQASLRPSPIQIQSMRPSGGGETNPPKSV